MVPGGQVHFHRSLSLRVDGVTIRGAGPDKSVLSFKGQKAGAEEPAGQCQRLHPREHQHRARRRDGLKVNEAENVTIRNVRVEWTGGPKTSNGRLRLHLRRPATC